MNAIVFQESPTKVFHPVVLLATNVGRFVKVTNPLALVSKPIALLAVIFKAVWLVSIKAPLTLNPMLVSQISTIKGAVRAVTLHGATHGAIDLHIVACGQIY